MLPQFGTVLLLASTLAAAEATQQTAEPQPPVSILDDPMKLPPGMPPSAPMDVNTMNAVDGRVWAAYLELVTQRYSEQTRLLRHPDLQEARVKVDLAQLKASEEVYRRNTRFSQQRVTAYDWHQWMTVGTGFFVHLIVLVGLGVAVYEFRFAKEISRRGTAGPAATAPPAPRKTGGVLGLLREKAYRTLAYLSRITQPGTPSPAPPVPAPVDAPSARVDQPTQATTEISLNLQGFAMRTSLIGLVIFAITILLYFMYLTIVYPIHETTPAKTSSAITSEALAAPGPQTI